MLRFSWEAKSIISLAITKVSSHGFDSTSEVLVSCPVLTRENPLVCLASCCGTNNPTLALIGGSYSISLWFGGAFGIALCVGDLSAGTP